MRIEVKACWVITCEDTTALFAILSFKKNPHKREKRKKLPKMEFICSHFWEIIVLLDISLPILWFCQEFDTSHTILLITTYFKEIWNIICSLDLLKWYIDSARNSSLYFSLETWNLFQKELENINFCRTKNRDLFKVWKLRSLCSNSL